MENFKLFSSLGILRPIVSESQLTLKELTKRFYPGMALYIIISATPVNRSLNYFETPVCPGKMGFISLYCCYN